MKKTYFIFLSLALGFMVASCQSDLEEMLNTNEDLATTRATDAENDAEAEKQKDEPLRSISISGDNIISGTEQKTYTVPSYNHTTYKMNWIFDSTAFTCIAGGGDNNFITIQLTNPERLANADLRAELSYRSNNVLHSADTKTIACNGPFAGTSSVRIIRASDSVQVYPSGPGVEPNTFYYAYFSNTMVSNMILDWTFTNAVKYNSYGYVAYFKTNNAYTINITVKGLMQNSTKPKTMINNLLIYPWAS